MNALSNRCLDRIDALLDELLASPPGNSGEWLARLVAVLRPRWRERDEAAALRVSALVRRLEARPEAAAAFGAHVNELLDSRMHRMLYADAGVLASEGFFGGLLRRTFGRLLPPATDEHYLRALVAEVFEESDDHEWLAAVPQGVWEALWAAFGVDGPGFDSARRRCRQELLEALRLVSVRLAALGTDPALLQYLPALARHESPFLAQAAEVRDFVAQREQPEAALPDDRHLDVLLDQCDGYVAAVRRHSRDAGVAVNLVFLLSRIEQLVARMRLLREVIASGGAAAAGGDATSTGGGATDFMLRLVRQENRRSSVGDLVGGATELLARRVTERASHSGEHYITASRTEYAEMFQHAAGAGVIIAMLALIKLRAATLHLPLLWEGIAYSLNYGLGFVLIHVLHMTIATKQPAMTAATLAASLDGRESRDARLDALADLAAQVSRTQWVSIAGNVLLAMLTAFGIAFGAAQFLGWPPAGPEKAAHLLHDLHPLASLALLHAAIAGVFLFLSGLISGYFDNVSLYHRVPQRLRRVKSLRALLGRERLDDLAVYVEHNLGALVGNFLFGCMLGFTPIVGKLLGLPIDIRHVAFASANFAYGLVGLDFDVPPATVLFTLAGVLLIGLTNLVVSFSLALRVALRSRGITREETEGLWPRVGRRFLARPRDFLLP